MGTRQMSDDLLNQSKIRSFGCTKVWELDLGLGDVRHSKSVLTIPPHWHSDPRIAGQGRPGIGEELMGERKESLL